MIRDLIDNVHPNLFHSIVLERSKPKQKILFTHGGGHLSEDNEMRIEPNLVLDNVPVGSTIADLTIVNNLYAAPYVYTFLSNPGSHFTISESEILLDSNPPLGTLTLRVQAANGVAILVADIIVEVLSTATPVIWTPGQRPFSIVSPLNIPLAAGSNYWDVLMPASTGSNYFTNPVFFLDDPGPAETTVCNVTYNAGWGNSSAGSKNLIMSPGMTGWAGNSDKAAIIVNGTTATSFWQLNRTSDTTATSNQESHDDLFTGTGFGTLSPFRAAGTLAAGCSDLAGALFKEEITRYGAINHLISFSGITTLINFSGGVGFPPAINNDGLGSDGIGIEGQIFAIPAGTAKPAGLSAEFGDIFWNTGINYGFINVDIGGSFTWYPGLVYDKNNPGNNFASANSWSSADLVKVRADFVKIFPLIKRTGYIFDGMNPAGLDEAWSPQFQVTARAQSTLMRITRDSDSAFLDVTAASNVNGLINSTAISNFCSVNPSDVGRLSAFYGQVHAFHAAAVGAVAPIIYQSGALENINGIPAALYDGATNYLTLQAGRDLAAARTTTTFSAIVQIPDHTSNYAIFGTDAVGGFECRINATTGFPQIMTNSGTVIATGTVAVPINTPTFIKFLYGFSNGNWSIRVNGADAGSGTNLVATTAGTTLIGAGSTSSDFFKGHIGAAFTTLFSWGGARALHIVETYMQDFWGTP